LIFKSQRERCATPAITRLSWAVAVRFETQESGQSCSQLLIPPRGKPPIQQPPNTTQQPPNTTQQQSSTTQQHPAQGEIREAQGVYRPNDSEQSKDPPHGDKGEVVPFQLISIESCKMDGDNNAWCKKCQIENLEKL
jgi:hypothetical protein